MACRSGTASTATATLELEDPEPKCESRIEPMNPTTTPAEDYPMVSAAEFEADPETWMAEATRHGAIRIVEDDGHDFVVAAHWYHQQLEAEAEAAAQWREAMRRVLGDPS
jgi:hypothetical protein